MIGDSRDNGGWVDPKSQHEGNRLSDWKNVFHDPTECRDRQQYRRRSSLCPLPPSTAMGGTNSAVEPQMPLRSAPSGEHTSFGS